MKDVVRLHQDLDLHVFPMRENKKPMGRWRKGGTDYAEVKPTDAEVLKWASEGPTGWCILCGGPARILVLDIEAAGMADLSEKGERIRHVLDRLPDTCKRPSPSGGEHAVLHISDGPAPDGHGHLLVERQDGKPRMTLLAEYKGHGSYAVELGQGRGPLQPDFALHDVTLAELQAILDVGYPFHCHVLHGSFEALRRAPWPVFGWLGEAAGAGAWPLHTGRFSRLRLRVGHELSVGQRWRADGILQQAVEQ